VLSFAHRRRVAKQRGLHHNQGNTCRRWHGTARECRIGEWENKKQKRFNQEPCWSRGCAVCAIIRHSFRLERAETRDPTRRSMFGRGIYSSSVSSKVCWLCVVTAAGRDAQHVQSDIWAENTGRARASSEKAMFLCTVVLGNPLALLEVDHDFDPGVRLRPPYRDQRMLG
jgi:hypothetical protein